MCRWVLATGPASVSGPRGAMHISPRLPAGGGWASLAVVAVGGACLWWCDPNQALAPRILCCLPPTVHGCFLGEHMEGRSLSWPWDLQGGQRSTAAARGLWGGGGILLLDNKPEVLLPPGASLTRGVAPGAAACVCPWQACARLPSASVGKAGQAPSCPPGWGQEFCNQGNGWCVCMCLSPNCTHLV